MYKVIFKINGYTITRYVSSLNILEELIKESNGKYDSIKVEEVEEVKERKRSK